MFDALEARVNRAAMAKLANAVAVIGDAVTPVIFDAEYKDGAVGIGMGATAPQMYLLNECIPVDFLDMTITVKGSQWRVVDIQQDSVGPAGTSLIILEHA